MLDTLLPLMSLYHSLLNDITMATEHSFKVTQSEELQNPFF